MDPIDRSDLPIPPPRPVIVVAVPRLPRDALIEVQLLGWQSRLGASLPVTFSAPKTHIVTDASLPIGRITIQSAFARRSLCSVHATVAWPSIGSAHTPAVVSASPSTEVEQLDPLCAAVWDAIGAVVTKANLSWSTCVFVRCYHVAAVSGLLPAMTRTCSAIRATSDSTFPVSVPVLSSIPVSTIHPAGSMMAVHALFYDLQQQQRQQAAHDIRGADRLG